MNKIFYDDFNSIIRIVISAPIIYLLVIGYIQLIGKRTTSQLNSFDWIVTVAMGSMVASVVIMKNVPVIDGAIAIFTLMGLQYVITKLMVHFKLWRKIIRSTPELLVFEGKFLEENMIRERMVKSEIYAAIREKNINGISEVYAIVLETDATFSVISKDEKNTPLSLIDVGGLPETLKNNLKEAQRVNSLLQA